MGDPIDPAGLYGKNLDASYFTDTDDLAKHLTDRHASDKLQNSTYLDAICGRQFDDRGLQVD